MTEHVRVAIVGSGFGGLGAAIRLKQDGENDFVVLEKADDIGGTWRDNSYPGCACDVPSNLYSYSFAPEPSWSRSFSPQPEIHAYLRRCVERFGLRPHLRLGHELTSATWEPTAQHWRLESTSGVVTADVLVAATGPLSEPNIPPIPGLESFQGRAFHSARWEHDYPLEGKKVAVVGTGASAIQFVPEIRKEVGHLTLFQRTPPWVLPRRERKFTDRDRLLFKYFPPAQRARRLGVYWVRELLLLPSFRHPALARYQTNFAKSYLARCVPDPELRKKLTPDYKIGCKRILLSNKYLRALTKENVSVVTSAVSEIRPHSVVAADGTEHEADTIIFGTGFHVTDTPIAQFVYGADGRKLDDVWNGSPRAYAGTSVPGFPNLFLLLGPNTGLGHTSVVFMIEAQIEHLRSALKALRANGSGTVEVTEQATAAWNAKVDRQLKPTVWETGGCASWYHDRTGRNSTLWPTYTFLFRLQMKRFRADAYRFEPARTSTPATV